MQVFVSTEVQANASLFKHLSLSCSYRTMLHEYTEMRGGNRKNWNLVNPGLVRSVHFMLTRAEVDISPNASSRSLQSDKLFVAIN